MFEPLLSMQLGLPEDIGAVVGAGAFHAAEDRIDRRLAGELPDMLRQRLLMQKRVMAGLRAEYTLSRAALLREIRRDIPDFADAELTALQNDGWLDGRMIDGEPMYFRRAYPSLLKSNAALARRAGHAIPVRDALLSPVIDAMKQSDLSYRIRVRASLRVADGAFRAGETYRAHLPLPKPAAQQRDIRVLSVSPEGAYIAPERAPQRTAFFERTLGENAPFAVEYEYTQSPRYCDPFGACRETIYPDAPPPRRDDLRQWPPHIAFTPYLRALAKEIAAGETRPLYIAKRVYDYITSRVVYSFMRPYLLIDNGAEYAALNLRGDCGLQALLFIALCRISGVPARWQSGLFIAPDEAGCHDWAQFYAEPFGWLFADCSFGGAAFRAGDEERRAFYFGNLDPFRMAANSAYMQAFRPPKLFLAADPYDNQRGECETPARGLAAHEFETEARPLVIKRL